MWALQGNQSKGQVRRVSFREEREGCDLMMVNWSVVHLPPQVGGGVVCRTVQVKLSKVQSEAADVLARSDGVGAARLM